MNVFSQLKVPKVDTVIKDIVKKYKKDKLLSSIYNPASFLTLQPLHSSGQMVWNFTASMALLIILLRAEEIN